MKKIRGMESGIFNHHVTDAVGYVPPNIVNHEMQDAAPKVNCIVNRDLKNCSTEDELAKVLGVFRYPGRVLGSTKVGDIIQLHPDLKSEWDWISRHYNRIGLEFTSDVIWNDDFNVAKNFPEHNIDVFFFGEKAHIVRPDENWFQITKHTNSKNNFIKLAKQLGVDVPDTICFSNKEEADYKNFDFPVFIKVDVSVSGLGVIKCNNITELESELDKLDSSVGFQIQKNIDAVAFLNLQYRVNGKGLERVIATEQVLDGCSHSGNSFPTIHQPWNLTDPLAHYIYQQGMKGYFAFDVAVARKGNGYKYYAIECNPRYNGASYPTNIALKLKIPSWTAKSFHTSFNSLGYLDLGDIEFSANKKAGIIIVNWGCILDKKIVAIIAGNKEEQINIEKKFLQKIS